MAISQAPHVINLIMFNSNFHKIKIKFFHEL